MKTKESERVIDVAESQLPLAAPLAVRPLDNGAIVHAPPAMTDLISQAIDKNLPVETMERLFALYQRMEDERARREFSAAMAGFKSDCPPVPRRTENAQFQVTRDGTKRNRRYAALEDIEATIRPVLGRHGLSFRWTDTKVEAGQLAMTCIVSHAGGHSETSAVVLPVDSKAGCSDQQKYGAAMTYAQRYSLIQALGLTTCDEDQDGNEPPDAGPTITESQAADLGALADEVKADKARFLKWLGVESVMDIPAARFKEAVAALEKKRGGSKA